MFFGGVVDVAFGFTCALGGVVDATSLFAEALVGGSATGFGLTSGFGVAFGFAAGFAAGLEVNASTALPVGFELFFGAGVDTTFRFPSSGRACDFFRKLFTAFTPGFVFGAGFGAGLGAGFGGVVDAAFGLT